MQKNDIFQIKGPQTGSTIAIIAGIHGNEHTGVIALKGLLPSLELKRGALYAIIANPPALRQNARQISKNLNRCFYINNRGKSYEDKRAREIIKILDKCEASLDLHAFNEDTGRPFIMTEQVGLKVANIFDVKTISTNWANEEPGTTDAYMCLNGKVGLCLECGPIPQYKKYQKFAERSILQFLSYYGLINKPVPFSRQDKRVIKATYSLIRTSQDFWVDPRLKSFQKLKSGQIFARHANKNYVAQEGDYIIFPRPQAIIGAEAFIVGREQSTPK